MFYTDVEEVLEPISQLIKLSIASSISSCLQKLLQVPQHKIINNLDCRKMCILIRLNFQDFWSSVFRQTPEQKSAYIFSCAALVDHENAFLKPVNKKIAKVRWW